MGTHGSPLTSVLEAPAKWIRSARSPADLPKDLKTLSTYPTTLEDFGRPYPDLGKSLMLGVQGKQLDHGLAPPIGLRITGYSL
jgi:hypothetical protein